MKKRKTYEISVIDKTYSKTISDETKFYTSDTALELVFKLKETEYTFESAEIVLLNINDKSLITRRVVKSDEGFVYTFEKDIIAHYGEWKCQLMLVENGEAHVSSPVKFRIENDLYSTKPQALSDVVSWVNLKLYAEKLVGEFKQAVDKVVAKNVEIENTFKTNEQNRQTAFENAEQSRKTTFNASESERDETFNTNETTRQTQELEREKAEGTRQTVFDGNEASRFETFNNNEATRQENETVRQQAESQRQSTFETNETERQTTFETAEQERVSSEIIRIENENQRNLTSVDEFVKLQDSLGGRNLLLNSDFSKGMTHWSNTYSSITNVVDKGIEISFLGSSTERRLFYQGLNLKSYGTDITISLDIKADEIDILSVGQAGNTVPLNIGTEWERLNVTLPYNKLNSFTFSIYYYNNDSKTNRFYIDKIKLEKGSKPTHWTPAPEDYTIVSKDDYYNHIKMMNDFKDSQFNQLKQAVISLGGTI